MGTRMVYVLVGSVCMCVCVCGGGGGGGGRSSRKIFVMVVTGTLRQRLGFPGGYIQLNHAWWLFGRVR